jgi:hypothetical protein
MYVLGRYGTYFLHLHFNEEEDRLLLKSAQYAEAGYDKHHQFYIE